MITSKICCPYNGCEYEWRVQELWVAAHALYSDEIVTKWPNTYGWFTLNLFLRAHRFTSWAKVEKSLAESEWLSDYAAP